MTVSKLSGGMKKRVSIACALAFVPPVMLMDEPDAALDLNYKAEIREWIRDFKSKDGIVLLSTHDADMILQCDRCYMLEAGRMFELKSEELSIKEMTERMSRHEI